MINRLASSQEGGISEAMSTVTALFPTYIYRADAIAGARLNTELEVAALSLSRDDAAGLRWCEKHGYPGYTSYASLNDLPWRIPAFGKLERLLDRHAANFAKALHWDLKGGKPKCDSLWVNVMPAGGHHTSHIHPNSVISGTYYVKVPQGAGPIVYEDPRIAMMMAAPPREFKSHVSETPQAGTLLLWESWLRHEVPLNRAEGERISVSFNYIIGSEA
jgi:uncharacterized protein (TIGR02466 family)